MKTKLLFAVLALMFFSACSSRKAETQKKVEKLSEITQNEIKTSDSEVFESTSISNIQEKNIKATPQDPEKPSSLNVTGNTVTWQNAALDITNKKENSTNTTNGSKASSKEDNSKSNKDSTVKEKGKKVERESISWGANLGIIFGIIAGLILLFLYFKTRK